MEHDNSHERLLGWTLALALVLHFALLQMHLPKGAEFIPGESSEAKKKEPIVVETLPDAKKPVVQSSKAKDDPEAKDEKARFAGEHRNRVKKEMQASVKGRFEEGEIARGGGKPQFGSGEEDGVFPEEEGEEEVRRGDGGKSGGPGLSDLMRLGRSPNALPKDILSGNQTILNTDKVLYASFINRIADQIYEPWVRHVEEASQEVLHKGRKLDPNVYITKLNVTMDDKGMVTGIQIAESCSIPELDEAPKRAFFDVASFPNPPSQLLDQDGFIRLTYEFHFEWKTSSFNIRPWAI